MVAIESYNENNYTAEIAVQTGLAKKNEVSRYWLGLTSLDDLRTNTLESASRLLISQYSGFWALNQPDPKSGDCVNAMLMSHPNKKSIQSWELSNCETLLPFMCRTKACPKGKLLLIFFGR